MNRKPLASYFVKNIKSSLKNNKSPSFYLKRTVKNRSISLHTITKKKNLSKGQNSNNYSSFQLKSERSHLNETIKKKAKKQGRRRIESEKNVKNFQSQNRSDFDENNFQQKGICTPKFGQKNIKAENLISYKLDLMYELKQVSDKFKKNFQQLSLLVLTSLSNPRQNLQKCLFINQRLLQKQWSLILRSCGKVLREKQNIEIQKMIQKWAQKRLKVDQLKQNLQKALQLLKI